MDLNAVVETGLSFGLVAMVGIAAAYDIGVQRIPNVVTVTGFVFALMLHGLTGWTALFGGLLGAMVCFALFVPGFALSLLGGGDVKLLIAVGAFLGWSQQLIVAIFATAVIGATLAIIAAIRQGALLKTLLGMRDLAVGLGQRVVSTAEKIDLPTLDKPGGVRNPYGVSIAAGAIIGLKWSGQIISFLTQ